MKAKSSTLATVVPEAEKTGRCEIRPNSYVRKIETDNAGRVTGVIYFDESRKEIFQRAKAVVLCANGSESARLLLISKSNLFPNGLANSSGLVGKHLMFNSAGLATGFFEHELNEFKSVAVTNIIHDFYDADPKRGFYGGGGIDMRFDVYPMGYGFGGVFPPKTARWGAEYKKALSQYYTRCAFTFGHATSLAVENNSISLDPTAKDAWGLPAMRVTYKDRASADAAHRQLSQLPL